MNLPILRLALATATLCSMGLTGCTLTNSAPATPINSTIGNIRGQAFGGNQPVVGAQIFVYAANTSGYGAASTLLSTTVPTTDNNGFFSITGDYTCTAGQQVYLYATGGDPGSGTNDNIGLLAVLGTCPASGTMADVTPYVWMNEVTTVAAAYSLAGFATDATDISDDEAVAANTTATLAQTGMANAFANAANLVNLATGTALTATPATGSTGVVPQSQINTIADVLAGCVNTASSTTSPPTPSSNCSTLFENATSDGTPSGTMPTDTASAAINIAHHPSANVATLWGLINPQPPYMPYSGTSAPADFTVSVLYPQGGTGTVGIAADGNGNAFATYGGGNLVYKITPAGVITTATVSAPRHLAIDASNNVWVPTTSTSTTSYNTITELDNNLGSPTAYPSFDGTAAVLSLNSITFASDGSLWANGARTKAIHLSSSGAYLGEITGLPTGTADIAINPNGIIGISGGINSGTQNNGLYLYSSAGAAIGTQPAGTGGGLASPDGVISDASGNFWIANNGTGANVVSVFTAAGAPVSDTGYSTAPLTALFSADFDGLGNYFVGSAAAGIYEMNSSGGKVAVLTPPTTANEYLAVDPSGNLWYGGKSYIGEMIGVAAPKVTPIVTATFNGKLSTRP
ncbi:MAG TPA: hypothetical protein VFC39_01570 [Acidobacteriaceae bacterium]|nr:hypothetical protein [Acidobacteriaceae bacterium]